MRFFRALVGVVMVFACLAGSDAAHAQLDRLRKHKAPHPEPLAAPPSIVIPEGEFRMGATGPDALEDEKPQHAVWLDRFEIDLHEVTTAHYAEFLAHAQRTVPWQWEAVDLAQHHDRPVIGVSWFDAEAYCRWRGSAPDGSRMGKNRSRGLDGRPSPGAIRPSEWVGELRPGCRFSYSQALTPVQPTSRGEVRTGCIRWQGMRGMGSRLVWRELLRAQSFKNPPGPASGSFRVVRGGSGRIFRSICWPTDVFVFCRRPATVTRDFVPRPLIPLHDREPGTSMLPSGSRGLA